MKSTQPIRCAGLLVILFWSMRLVASTTIAAEVGFSRIIHAWTNYSTAFNATHDPDPEVGDYVTLASIYTPDKYVRPSSYGVPRQLAAELFVTPLPQLRIHGSAAGLELTWPAALNGWALESTGTLVPDAGWLHVSGTPSTTNGWMGLTIPFTPPARFFRLRRTP